MKITNKPKPKIENLFSVAALSKDMGVSRQTIYNWIESGTIKQVDIRGVLLVDKSTYTPSVKKKTTTDQV